MHKNDSFFDFTEETDEAMFLSPSSLRGYVMGALIKGLGQKDTKKFINNKFKSFFRDQKEERISMKEEELYASLASAYERIRHELNRRRELEERIEELTERIEELTKSLESKESSDDSGQARVKLTIEKSNEIIKVVRADPSVPGWVEFEGFDASHYSMCKAEYISQLLYKGKRLGVVLCILVKDYDNKEPRYKFRIKKRPIPKELLTGDVRHYKNKDIMLWWRTSFVNVSSILEHLKQKVVE